MKPTAPPYMQNYVHIAPVTPF